MRQFRTKERKLNCGLVSWKKDKGGTLILLAIRIRASHRQGPIKKKRVEIMEMGRSK